MVENVDEPRTRRVVFLASCTGGDCGSASGGGATCCTGGGARRSPRSGVMMEYGYVSALERLCACAAEPAAQRQIASKTVPLRNFRTSIIQGFRSRFSSNA
jgi:hypothetical protein